MIDNGFRDYLIEHESVLAVLPNAAELGAVQQGSSDQVSPDTRIFFYRTGSNRQLFLDAGSGLATINYDVECISPDIDTAQNLAEAVKAALHGYRGEMDDLFVDGCFVEDHSDQYEPKSDADAGDHIASLQVTIIHS